MRVSSASTRAPYSVFNACSSARSAPTSSAAPATTGNRASASSAAMGLKLNMDFLLPKPTNTSARAECREGPVRKLGDRVALGRHIGSDSDGEDNRGRAAHRVLR